MTKPWKPDEALERRSEPAECVPPEPTARERASWPAGATAGLLMVAAGCIGLAAVLYRLAAPRDLFAP